MAAMRWYTPAAVTPPNRSMNQRAQAVSLYFSGMPVKTSTVKLVKTRKCIQRWKTLNRRYSMRVRTCASRGVGGLRARSRLCGSRGHL